jgi:hypothetical protein
MLREMPWWLARLTETAIGQTRMSDNAGRKSARRKDLDGDIALAACIEQLPPKEEDLEKARKARERAALAHALATGGINARASELLSEINDSLGYWMRVLCEARGIVPPQLGAGRSLGELQARWLYLNAAAITAYEDAETIVGDIEGHLEDIVRMVNRPVRVWFLGECESWDERRETPCGADLRVQEGNAEVICPRCHTTHSVHRLFLANVDRAERHIMPWKDLLRVSSTMGDRQVPRRTLERWRATGQLQPHHWRGPDGEIELIECGPRYEPMYSWSDVQRLQLRKPQKAATGAAAHERMG